MCYFKVTVHGWFPPELHHRTPGSNINPQLLLVSPRNTPVHAVVISIDALLTCVPARVYFVSSERTEAGVNPLHHIVHRLTFARRTLISLCIDKVEIPLHIDQPAQPSRRLLSPGRGAAVQPLSRLILRCCCSAHSPGIEPHSPRLHPPAIM